MNLRRLICPLCLLIVAIVGKRGDLRAQEDLFQLSGIVSDADTKFPIAYANIEVVGTYRWAYSSKDGFFSCVVGEKDTIQFAAIGYKTKMYIVPDSVSDDIFSIAVFMSRDTIELQGVEIYPWPDKDEFREAFLAYKEAQEYQVGPIPGIKRPDEIDTVPTPPQLYKNPISFLYEEIVVPIQWKKKKRDKAKELPKWE